MIPTLRASLDQGPNGWQGSFELPPGKTDGILRVVNDPADPNYYYRLVAADGRNTGIQILKRTADMSGAFTITFLADGPLVEPSDSE